MKTKRLVWENRERDLKKVKRYADPEHCFEVMYYRTDLSVHVPRVGVILETLIPYASELNINFDPELCRSITKYHDDPEMLGYDKSHYLKLKANEMQQKLFEKEELESIEAISRMYPLVTPEGYAYKELLLEALYKKSPESQLHSFADKYDGYCEAIHELLAGNSVFFEPVFNYERGTFGIRHEKFYMINELFIRRFSSYNPFLDFGPINLMKYLKNGRLVGTPHTKESILTPSGIPFYDEWKRLTVETIPKGMELLTKQKEFHTM